MTYDPTRATTPQLCHMCGHPDGMAVEVRSFHQLCASGTYPSRAISNAFVMVNKTFSMENLAAALPKFSERRRERLRDSITFRRSRCTRDTCSFHSVHVSIPFTLLKVYPKVIAAEAEAHRL